MKVRQIEAQLWSSDRWRPNCALQIGGLIVCCNADTFKA